MLGKISLIILCFSFLVFPQNDIRVISSDASSLVFEFSPKYTDTSVVNLGNKNYRRVSFSGGFVLDELNFGSPQLQKRVVNVGVPDEFGTTFEILSSSYKDIPGEIIPIPEVYQEGGFPAFNYKIGAEYFNSVFTDDLMTFYDFGISRGLKVQSFIISPVQFNSALNTIRLYTRLLVRVNFSGGGKFAKTPADNFLRDVILNFNIAKNWVEETPERLRKIQTNSVLSTGRWFRFEVPEEGMYRITRSMLASYGIDANTVDPRTIKIYNNGGKTLPEGVTRPRPEDLVENAIIIVGEDDGRFDANDYILFYGRSYTFWDFDPEVSRIVRMRHSYSDKNFYWITSGGNPGKRMEFKSGLDAGTTTDFFQNSSAAFADWEVDKINLGKSGRQFFGDDFSSAISSRTYVNTLTNRINSEPIRYTIRFAVGTSTGMELIISDNGNELFKQFLSGYGSTSYTAGYDYVRSFTFNNPLPDNRSALTFKVNPASVSSVGYLDYFEIEYKKELRANSDYLMFFSEPNTGVIEYHIYNFSNSNIKVFDVSDFANVKQINNFSFHSGGECKFKFAESSTARKKYIALGNDNFKTPVNPSEIANSNVRGETTGAKFIIVTHKNFMEPANRLKNYRESQQFTPLPTIVVDIEQIYNEFSGGSLDVTALRDYLKYAYNNWQIKPEYVLLFGKGTYDYRNIEKFGDNFIPTWQTVQSLALLNSFVTDDYFAFIDGDDSKVDIALGRIPVSNLAEANNVINKIINYESSGDKGNWRNLVTFIADDGIGSAGSYEGARHTSATEIIAETILPANFNRGKIYAAAYPDVITGQGRRKPAVNQAIIEAINNGTLLINYIGHGSPELWAHEYIFEKSVALPLMKNDKHFFVCAATCDFGYFDIPNFQSSTEAMMFLPNSGSIGGFTSARLVYSDLNHDLNEELFRNFFLSERDTFNLPIRLGDVAKKTKLWRLIDNDRKYILFGDPTLRLHIPQYPARIDSVNGTFLTSDVQIKALSKTKIDGVVLRPDNSVWEEFSGEGLLTVFDSERIVKLLIPSLTSTGVYLDVKQQGGVIFNGRVSIANGRFSADFVVPKDISYENKNGKIVFYFFDNVSDGIAFTTNVIIGGTDSTANDGKGPEIEIFFDNIDYGITYLVGPSPKLIVKLFDETGLNTTGTGIGHKLEGVLNQQENNPIDFTNFFTGDLDAGGRSGQINYKFNNLGFGEYSLLVKAWDVFNNFSSEMAYFSVVSDSDFVIRDVYNYPNPFTSSTTFTFNQNLNDPIDVKIKIYTIAGRLIKEIEDFNVSRKFVTIDWDGRDADGSSIANGTYLYKIIVKTVDGEQSSSVTGKLAVIR